MKFNKGDILVPQEAHYPERALVVEGYDGAGRMLTHYQSSHASTPEWCLQMTV